MSDKIEVPKCDKCNHVLIIITGQDFKWLCMACD